MSRSPKEKVLFRFADKVTDGMLPLGVVRGGNANLFGLTINGGPADHGVLFKLGRPQKSNGTLTETALYSFGPGKISTWPRALIFRSGMLYGTTPYG